MRGAPILAAGLTLALSITASAQSGDARDEEARALFLAGEVAFEDGRLEDALAHFQRSYELSGRSGLLFNIANVHDRLHHVEEAIAGYERYLAAEPNGERAAFARNRVRSLREQLDRARGEEPAESEAEPSSEPSPPPPTSGSVVPAVVVLASGGAALLGALGTTGWLADRVGAADTCAAEPRCRNLDVVSAERDAAIGVTISLAAIGVAGVIAGAVWLAQEPGSGETAAACVPGALAVRCEVRF